MNEWVALIAGIGVGGLVAFWLLHLAWRLRSEWRIRRAGPRRLFATRHRIRTDPRGSGADDLRFGPGGRQSTPVPPFTFIEELHSGSHPAVSVRDGRQRLWRVKWGDEVKPEAFCVRFAAACGYFAEVTHYVASGTIAGVTGVQRARGSIGADGSFKEARFELEDRSVRMLFEEHSWAWDDNPFLGSAELDGLKIVVMLLSNWDTKDRRDVARGSNTAIFEHQLSRFSTEARYLISDWGGAMGKWGNNVVSRGRWDPDGFEIQSESFVSGVHDGVVDFAYQGQRTAEIARAIPVEHVRWFCSQTRHLTDQDLRDGLRASGATDDEAERFARALLRRLDLMRDACRTPAVGTR